ncbi:hypothetical protein [Aurantiacibacter sp. MUD61]|uniref:hypothetical protein n=1 Tax=Aurantiacibacter sp. MUD61 TaxID=3009083 RepID=UPI0022F0D266|nr:hypothetical protein [Aurantiacibacter sp. MUD61]
MAKLTKPPIPLKMYKHFAVVTLSMTAAIAMFADSDQREAIEAETAITYVEQTEVAPSDRRVGGMVDARQERTQGSFGSENGGFGGGSSSPGGGGSWSVADSRSQGRISVPGYTRGWIDSLTDEQYESFLASLPPELRDPEAAREQAIRASARRSGRRGSSADAPT